MLRSTLKEFSIASLLSSGDLVLPSAERKALVAQLGDSMLNTSTRMIDTRAGLGATEARIDAAIARTSAQGTALAITREALVGIDPYETATRLQHVETQLEAVYAVTARLSQLSLASVLR